MTHDEMMASGLHECASDCQRTARPTGSPAEILLTAQLEQAGIPFEREYRFAPPRRWRADFVIGGPGGWHYVDVPVKNGVAVLPDGRTKESTADIVRVPVLDTIPIVERDLLVEIDGGGWTQGRHTRGSGVEKDAEKQSAAAILGYRVIRCTPRQVENGTALSWIRQALGIAEVAA